MSRVRANSAALGWAAAWVGATCLGLSGASFAEPAAPTEAAMHTLRLSGFGTVGVSHTSAPPGWGFLRDSEQPPNDGGTRADTDSRLGLQANYAIGPRLELIGQVLLTRRLSDARSTDALAWGFAAWRPTETLSVRAGRVSVTQYQLSDYRSVGLAYPFVRPPPEFYSLLPSAIDGLDATQSWRDDSGAIWKFGGHGGRTQQADSRNQGFRPVRPIYGLFLSREEQGLLVKASASRLKLAGDVAAAAPLVAGLQALASLQVAGLAGVAAEATALQRPFLPGTVYDYVGLGLNLDRDDWLLMVEASHARARGTVTVDAGYVLLGHRWGAFTPYVVAAVVKNRTALRKPEWEAALTPVLGPAGAAQAQALGNVAHVAVITGPSQRTGSLGLRWDVGAQSALKIQVDRTQIRANGSVLWANGTATAARARVFSATYDFAF